MLQEKNGSVEQRPIADVLESISNERVPTHIRSLKIGARAVGALAVGVLAIGALAIGALTIDGESADKFHFHIA